MKILFLDQSGNPGGAELCLLDIAKQFGDRCLVCLFADGSFRTLLANNDIPSQVFETSLQVRKDSHFGQQLTSLTQLIPLISRVTTLSRDFDVIYANTQKALVVGAISSLVSRRPLVYHLHDIISPDHFSPINRRLIVTLANQFAAAVIANSRASLAAFVSAGGSARRTTVVYNGFRLEEYDSTACTREQIRQSLGIAPHQFVVGCFSRLSPWKGQHILLDALQQCSSDVIALFVGDALFGEQDYVKQLYQTVESLGLEQRVHFLGFRSDIVSLMCATDLVAHTSTAPEPFGRVIVEAMLSARPVVATRAGGAIEIIEHNVNGWLTTPESALELAAIIHHCRINPQQAAAIASQGKIDASQRFNLANINHQLQHLLSQVI